MAVALRLSRGGSKKRPFFRIVAKRCEGAKRWKIPRETRNLQPYERKK